MVGRREPFKGLEWTGGPPGGGNIPMGEISGFLLSITSIGGKNNMAKRGSGSQAVDFVTKGTYQRLLVEPAVVQHVSGTEGEITAIAGVILTPAEGDAMFSWIRYKSFIYSTDAVGDKLLFEYALIKCGTGDALQDLNDSVKMEDLHKQSRVFARDTIFVRSGDAKTIKFELFNVALDNGEELRLVIRPWITTTGASVFHRGVLEWRQVGV